ncbi:MAG TPA: PH domain-containing protein [Actinomycetota bacterium]|nr:PH domain-containing protein [Actinomycetota bacterium]
MFPRKLLIPGEEVVLELRPHPVALAAPAAVLIVATAAAAWIATKVDGAVVWIVWAAWLATVLGYVMPRFIAWFTSIFVVSTDRVISREGFIAKRSMEIPLEQVNDVRFEQGIFDRLVGAGTLLIQSASTSGTNTFEDIRHPEDVQRTIFHQGELNQHRGSHSHRGASPTADAPSRPDGPPASPSVATELERLADLHARGVLNDEEFEAQKGRILGRG